MRSKFEIDRRTLLRGMFRGAAVTVALPMFEAMMNGNGTALAAGGAFPHRFIVWFWGNGVMPDWWEPKTEGPNWEPNIETEPLRPYRDYISFVSGCKAQAPMIEHVLGHTTTLTGNGVNTNGAPDNLQAFYRATPWSGSVDQMLCGTLRTSETMMPNGIQLGCELDNGGPAANIISHRPASVAYGPTGANPATLDPGLAWDSLFGFDFRPGPGGTGTGGGTGGGGVIGTGGGMGGTGGGMGGTGGGMGGTGGGMGGTGGGMGGTGGGMGGTGGGGGVITDPRQRLRQSVLDAVKGDAARLKKRLGKNDQHRLDSHMEGIRNIEKRIAATAGGQPPPMSGPPEPPSPAALGDGTCSKPARPGGFSDIRAKASLMADIMTYAIACDLTRVITFQITAAARHHTMPEVGVTKDIHDSLSHHISDPGNAEMYQAGVRNYMAALGDFLGKLKSVNEGAENLLDHVAIMGTSCTAHPFHDHERWPLVVAGRANGALKYPGVHYKAPYTTTSTKFTFTLMKALGYSEPQWGEGAAQVNSVFSEIMG
ncbi:MAG: DUF1552 domain-containing protein [Myxococcaceae bacterium]|nr:DUF1552 domain-containing protein [Myxococcaceae bacterium]